MLLKRTKWFCMIVFVAAIGFSIAVTSAFAGDNSGGTKEGITVHGSWKIEVFNPDGTLISVSEFENALEPTGMSTLSLLLMGRSVAGGLTVFLDGSPRACNNPNNPVQAIACLIVESDNPSTMAQSKDLTVTYNGNGFTMNGSVIAENTGSISSVTTQTITCNDSNTTISACRLLGSGNPPIFTRASISPVGVVPGQLIQVTVTISFS